MSASGVLSGAASGLSMGSSFGPYGALIGGVLGGISGLFKEDPAKDPANNVPRPKYKIPKEIFQNKALYESMANSSRVPGQSYIENQIGQNTANSLAASQKAAGSSADALAAVGNIQQNTNNQLNELAKAGAEYQFVNKQNLARANETLADYKQQEFDYNKNQPYQISYAQKQKILDQQRMDNSNAVNTIAGIGMTYGGSKMGDSSSQPMDVFSITGKKNTSGYGSTPYESTKKYNANAYLK